MKASMNMDSMTTISGENKSDLMASVKHNENKNYRKLFELHVNTGKIIGGITIMFFIASSIGILYLMTPFFSFLMEYWHETAYAIAGGIIATSIIECSFLYENKNKSDKDNIKWKLSLMAVAIVIAGFIGMLIIIGFNGLLSMTAIIIGAIAIPLLILIILNGIRNLLKIME